MKQQPEDDGGPRITVHVDRKIGLPDYGSVSCGLTLSRLRPDITPEEIDDLIAVERIVYDKMVDRLREEVVELRRRNGL